MNLQREILNVLDAAESVQVNSLLSAKAIYGIVDMHPAPTLTEVESALQALVQLGQVNSFNGDAGRRYTITERGRARANS